MVDDDARLRRLLQRYLTEHGYHVTTAADAAEAKATLKNFAFDLMVLDVMMPGQDGVSLTTELRAVIDLPILLLTALGETEDRVNGLAAGADDYLVKPFDPRELLLRIATILRRVAPAAPSDQPLRFGPFAFDAGCQELRRGDQRDPSDRCRAVAAADPGRAAGARDQPPRARPAQPDQRLGSRDRHPDRAAPAQARARSAPAPISVDQAWRRLCSPAWQLARRSESAPTIARLPRVVPRSLFSRALLIVIMPLLILQAVLAYVFYERHWDSVTRWLAVGFAGEVGLMVELLEAAPTPEAARSRVLDLAREHFDFAVSLEPGGRAAAGGRDRRPAAPSALDRRLAETFAERAATGRS